MLSKELFFVPESLQPQLPGAFYKLQNILQLNCPILGGPSALTPFLFHPRKAWYFGLLSSKTDSFL